MNVKCSLTGCIHNNVGHCQAPEVYIDNKLHGYPECHTAEVVGNYVPPLPLISINAMSMNDEGDIYYLSDYYEITQQRYNPSVRGFRLQFFPRVHINRHLPTIYDESAKWEYLQRDNPTWPRFTVDTGIRGAKSREEVIQIMEAYQHALDTIRVAIDFFKVGGRWESILGEYCEAYTDVHGWKQLKGEESHAAETNAGKRNGKKR